MRLAGKARILIDTQIFLLQLKRKENNINKIVENVVTRNEGVKRSEGPRV